MPRRTKARVSESFSDIDECLPEEKDWDLFYPRAVTFYKKYGHCNVPSELKKYKKLHKWVSEQRQRYKCHELSPLRKRLLKQIEFIWEPDKAWEIWLSELIAYGKKHNSFRIDSDDPVHKPLKAWISSLRRKKIELTASQIKALNAIGFFLKEGKNKKRASKEEAWKKMYAKLVVYFKHHGHSNVSVLDKQKSDLGFWVYQQRQIAIELTDRQKLKLAKINFKWADKVEPVSYHPRKVTNGTPYNQHGIPDIAADENVRHILKSFKIFANPPRMEVLRKMLLSGNEEFTMRELVGDIISDNIKISAGTVESTLQLFWARGLIRKVSYIKAVNKSNWRHNGDEIFSLRINS